ncbi:dephospho-CoA kinase [Lutimonas saemankumensis]|uniref:dephospho-CoA kinase n=1 Tax=Lutimonas saemankumensis TaxID=483016 RepID=UPI001CD4394E|nr:dephospho-CoA kinase [Lutimonas saemankumensis]MCA0931484.1 dephospho-CoA kinase [Lutimonas saemankumensis]
MAGGPKEKNLKKVGLTGGIGSGKSTVAKMFEDLDIPVYYADDRAKWLMVNSTELRQAIKNTFGNESYTDQKLNRAYLATKVFKNRKELDKLNAIVHPAVRRDFKEWIEKQNGPYVIQENPLIFESQNENQFDAVISVVADKEIRIKRVMSRDGHTRSDVINRMKNQTSDEVRRSKSDFVINNTDISDTRSQVFRIHQRLLILNP